MQTHTGHTLNVVSRDCLSRCCTPSCAAILPIALLGVSTAGYGARVVTYKIRVAKHEITKKRRLFAKFNFRTTSTGQRTRPRSSKILSTAKVSQNASQALGEHIRI